MDERQGEGPVRRVIGRMIGRLLWCWSGAHDRARVMMLSASAVIVCVCATRALVMDLMTVHIWVVVRARRAVVVLLSAAFTPHPQSCPFSPPCCLMDVSLHSRYT